MLGESSLRRHGSRLVRTPNPEFEVRVASESLARPRASSPATPETAPSAQLSLLPRREVRPEALRMVRRSAAGRAKGPVPSRAQLDRRRGSMHHASRCSSRPMGFCDDRQEDWQSSPVHRRFDDAVRSAVLVRPSPQHPHERLEQIVAVVRPRARLGVVLHSERLLALDRDAAVRAV